MWYTTFLIDVTHSSQGSSILIPVYFYQNSLVVFAVFCMLVIILSTLGFTLPAQIDLDMQGFKITDHKVAKNYNAMMGAVQTRELYLERQRSKVITRRMLLGEQAFKTIDPPTRRSVRWRIHVTYVATGSNLLEPDLLHSIRDIEQKIQNTHGYNNFCLVEPNGKACAPPVSVIGYYFPSFDAAGQPLLDGKGELVDMAASSEALAKMGMYWFAGRDFTPKRKRTKYLRTDFLFAGPLEGYSNIYDDEEEQIRIFTDWAENLLPVLKSASTEDITVLYGGDGIEEKEIVDALLHDLYRVIAVFAIVIAGFWWHTESFFLTSCAMLQFAAAAPLAYFFYRLVFCVPYMTLLNFLSIFVIVGLGLTNFTIFHDIFRNCHTIDKLDIRLAYTVRKAGHSILLTSITMSVAFATVCFNEIPVVRVFGLLMSIVVVVNFLFIMVGVPTVLIIFHNHIQYWLGMRELVLWAKGRFKGSISQYRLRKSEHGESQEDATADEGNVADDKSGLINGRRGSIGDSAHDCLSTGPKTVQGVSQPNDVQKEDSDRAVSDAGEDDVLTTDEPMIFQQSVVFLRDTWSGWIIRHKLPILFLFTALLVITAVFLSFMEPAAALPQLFPQNSNYHQFHTTRLEKFTSVDNCDACSGVNQPNGGFVPNLGNGDVSVRVEIFLSGTTENRWSDHALQDAYAEALKSTTPTTIHQTSQISFLRAKNGVDPENDAVQGLNIDQTIRVNDAESAKRCVLDLHTKFRNEEFVKHFTTEVLKRPTIDSKLPEKAKTRLLRGPAVIIGDQKTLAYKPLTLGSSTTASKNPEFNPLAETKIFLDSLPDMLPPSDESSLDIDVVWGVVGLRYSSGGIWRNPFQKYYGEPVYNFAFKGGTPEEQVALLRSCKQFEESSITKRVKRCIISQFADYVAGLQNDTFPSGRKASFPMSRERFVQEFKAFTTGSVSKDVGFSADGRHLEWIRAVFRSKVANTLPSFDRYNHYRKWEELMGQVNANNGDHLARGFETSAGWVDMMTEIACVNGAKMTAVLGVFFVFMLITNLSGSMALGSLAFGAVASIVVMTLGIFAMDKWTMGAVEAIVVSMLVGMSCTSIVHICDAYITCGLTWHKPDLKDSAQRSVRTRAALAQVGVPLMSSAVLFMAASVILCFATIQIFSKVAIAAVTNTAIGSLHVFGFLPAVLATLGPEVMKFTWSLEWIALRFVVGLVALGMGVLIAYGLSLEDMQ